MISSSSFDFSLVYAQLTSFANLSNFWSLFNTAFGSSYDSAKAATLRSQWQSGNFSQSPKIEIVSSNVLGSANGAYSASTNKIYLSDRFVATAGRVSLEAVFLEEFGHFVDAQVNRSDSAGDEGAIFSALVLGESLDANTLQALKAENDHATITVNGQVIQVELQIFTGTNGPNTIVGTLGDDTIVGTLGHDSIEGWAGNDVINGGAGNDGINAGEGNDTIDGGAGNDSIVGDPRGAGNDVINGGAGNDDIRSGAGNDVFEGNDGNDVFEGDEGNDFINGGAGDDSIFGGGNLGGSSDSFGNDTIDGGAGNDTIDGGAGNDFIAGNDVINGGDGNDVINGGDGNDGIEGGRGNDTIDGGAGKDVINGDNFFGDGDNFFGDTFFNKRFGAGDDFINGGAGDDIIRGGRGNDTIDGGAGNDVIDGYNFFDARVVADDDVINGGAGNDTIRGDDGSDTIDGGIGNDSIDGGIGNDSLIGGDGDDTFIGSKGDDEIKGDSGSNTADYSLLEQAITLKPFGVVEKAGNLGKDSLVKIQKIIASNLPNDTIDASTTPAPSTGITANLATGTLTVKGTGPILPLKFNVSNFENVIGTNFDDTITGDKGNNRLIGNTGKDTLTGGAGNDFLDGGDGNDSLTGGVGNDTLIGGLGADKFVFTNPTESIDIIKDFSFAEGDKIQISLRKFAATPLKETLGQFNYDSLSGNLLFLGNVLVTLENKPSDFTLKPGDQLGIQFL